MAGPPRSKPPRPPGAFTPMPSGSGAIPVFRVVFLVALSTAGIATLATVVTQTYGYGLFMLLPLAAGFASALLCNRGRKWDWSRTSMVLALTLGLTGFLMLGIEGIVCLLMASVISAALASIGAIIAWIVSKMKSHQRTMLLLVCGIAPITMGFEQRFKSASPLLEQTTTIEVNAPPEVIWRFVPSFPRIETAPDGLLAHGLAYPIEATMNGTGVGARRSCVLSTGHMPEIVTRWEPGRVLEFDVLETPPAMFESNPFFNAKPRHVEGYFTVKHGRFVLIPLEGGRTRIEGTSWFQHDLWPQAYWAPITSRVVKAVHERVLKHIKQLAENCAAE